MNSTLLAVILTVAAGTLSALSTYAIARRRSSGKIARSDATILWTESQAMRRELRDELIATREEAENLRKELDTTREELEAARREIHALRDEVARLREELGK